MEEIKKSKTLSRRNFLFKGGLAALGTLGAGFLLKEPVTRLVKKTDLSLKGGSRFYSERKKMMGTWVSISLYSSNEEVARKAMDEAFAEIKAVDLLMSIHNPSSQASRLNKVAGSEALKVDFRMIEVLSKAQEISALSKGAYDLSILPLMNLYGFYSNKGIQSLPKDSQIQKVLESVSYKNIEVNSLMGTLGLKKQNMGLDFGSIGKGYSLDRAVLALKKNGIKSALVDAGGNLFALGAPHEDEDPRMGWAIGIRDPKGDKNLLNTLILRNQAVATSGIDQTYVKVDSNEIGHIFNAVTGEAMKEYRSCSAVARTGLESDALSTTGYILGLEKSKSLFPESQFYFYV